MFLPATDRPGDRPTAPAAGDSRARRRVARARGRRGMRGERNDARLSSSSSVVSTSSVFEREKLVEWIRARGGDGFKARAHARNLARACVECAREGAMTLEEVLERRPVSYTHLTLPTILLV